MIMTREDVLRELELLPMWQLRVPAAFAAAPAADDSQQVTKINPQLNTNSQLAKVTEKSQILTAAETGYFALISDDKKWAFVLPQALTGAANTLLNNILMALQISKTRTKVVGDLTNVKVIIAFGEIVAQQLLGVNDSIEILRTKPQSLLGSMLIVTYHPNDLLEDLALKPKMWDDLCIAKSLIAS